jgi:flagellar basal body-associated protein FliL
LLQNVENWFKHNNLKLKDYKVSIAYDLLDLATEERQEMLITDEGKDKLKELYKSIGKILKNGIGNKS